MADTKTSAETAASALDGTELVRGVQGGGNVKITAAQIADYALGANRDGPLLLGPGGDTADQIELGGLVGRGIPVPYVRGGGTNNTVTAFDVMPRGAPTSIAGYGYSWLDVCSKDISAAVLAVQCAHVAVRSDFVEFSMRAFSVAGDESTPKLPAVFGVGGDTDVTECFRSNTDGTFQFGSANIAANGSVATVLGSLGPPGSNTTVQQWFKVKNASGVVRYIPGF
jgi:hypothetical protein